MARFGIHSLRVASRDDRELRIRRVCDTENDLAKELLNGIEWAAEQIPHGCG